MTVTADRIQSVLCSIGGHVNCGGCDCHCHIQYKVAHIRKDDPQSEIAGLLYEFWYNNTPAGDRYQLIQKWHTVNEVNVTLDRIDEIFDASTRASAKEYWSLWEVYDDLGFTLN